MNKLVTVLILILAFRLSSQTRDTLYVNYINHAPFAYKEGEEIKGIEIDLVKEYVQWLKQKKGMTVVIKYSLYADYEKLYEQTRLKSRNSFGLASSIITQNKNPEIEFSLPYIKNVAFCITNFHVPDIKIKSQYEITKTLGSKTALTINSTSLNKYILELKKTNLQDLRITYMQSESKILDEVSKNVLTFAYVDAVTFWNYLRNNPSKSLKLQRLLNQSKEEIGFILPKGCPHSPLFKEFFTSFKVGVVYTYLLEKYLGAYMAHNLALK